MIEFRFFSTGPVAGILNGLGMGVSSVGVLRDIPGVTVVSADLQGPSRLPYPNDGNRLIRLEFETERLEPVDEVASRSAGWLIGLLQRSDVSSGQLSLIGHDDTDVFARWGPDGVTLQLYHSATREKYGSWGGVDHRILWEIVPDALHRSGLAFTIDEDPIRVGPSSHLGLVDPLSDGVGWDEFLQRRFTMPEFDGSLFLLANSAASYRSLHNHFHEELLDFGGPRMSWADAVNQQVPGTFMKASGKRPAVYLNRIIVLVAKERHLLWERAVPLVTHSSLGHERANQAAYRWWDRFRTDCNGGSKMTGR